MRNEKVRKILEDMSPEREKEIDDMLDDYTEKVKKYHQSLSDKDKFITIVESEDFNSELMTNCMINEGFIAPLYFYDYYVTIGDDSDYFPCYIFTKQNLFSK